MDENSPEFLAVCEKWTNFLMRDVQAKQKLEEIKLRIIAQNPTGIMISLDTDGRPTVCTKVNWKNEGF